MLIYNKKSYTASLTAIFLLLILFQHLLKAGPEHSAHTEAYFEKGKILFPDALDSEAALDISLQFFKKYIDAGGANKPLATVYIGALYVIKGKHSSWPFTKLKWANKGLDVMDEGVYMLPDNIEALFVRGTIRYNLPSFLGYKDKAIEDFNNIIKLLPFTWKNYEQATLNRIIDYLINEDVPLGKNERNLLAETGLLINRTESFGRK